MRIAIKDDEPKRLRRMADSLREYYSQYDDSLQIDIFRNNEDLLVSFQSFEYSIVFLQMERREGDIPGIESNAVDIAREMRKTKPFLPIIFMNWINNSIVEFSFVAPRHYVFDTSNRESILPVLNSISNQLAVVPDKTLCITAKDKSIQTIRISDIIYAEVMRKIITIHLAEGKTLETVCTMKSFASQLSVYPEFIVPHNSYIVNALYISHISVSEISFHHTTKTIPISRNRINDVISAYQDYFRRYQILPYPIEDRLATIGKRNETSN